MIARIIIQGLPKSESLLRKMRITVQGMTGETIYDVSAYGAVLQTQLRRPQPVGLDGRPVIDISLTENR